jgi:hypothetical protein
VTDIVTWYQRWDGLEGSATGDAEALLARFDRIDAALRKNVTDHKAILTRINKFHGGDSG